MGMSVTFTTIRPRTGLPPTAGDREPKRSAIGLFGQPERHENGTPVSEVCRKIGIAEATFYNWRKRYAGLMPSG